jgi:hypothetical protein
MLLDIRLGAHISTLCLQFAMNSNYVTHGYVLYYNHYNLEPNVPFFISYMTTYTHTSFTVLEIWLHVKFGRKDSTKYCKVLKLEDLSFLGYNAMSLGH